MDLFLDNPLIFRDIVETQIGIPLHRVKVLYHYHPYNVVTYEPFFGFNFGSIYGNKLWNVAFWIVRDNPRLLKYLAKNICRDGIIHLLAYLPKQDLEDIHALSLAIPKKKLSTLQWIDQHHTLPLKHYQTAIYDAVYHGHLQLVQWLYQARTDYPDDLENDIWKRCLIYGQLGIAEWILKQKNFKPTLIQNYLCRDYKNLTRTISIIAPHLLDLDDFDMLIQNGHLEQAQQIYWTDPNRFSRKSLSSKSIALLERVNENHDLMDWISQLLAR